MQLASTATQTIFRILQYDIPLPCRAMTTQTTCTEIVSGLREICAALEVGEFSLSFFGEGGHAFLLVLCCKETVEESTFEAGSFLEC